MRVAVPDMAASMASVKALVAPASGASGGATSSSAAGLLASVDSFSFVRAGSVLATLAATPAYAMIGANYAGIAANADDLRPEHPWAGAIERVEKLVHELRTERQGANPLERLGELFQELRAELIDKGRAVESHLRLADLADGFFIGNSLRGLIPARLIQPHPT